MNTKLDYERKKALLNVIGQKLLSRHDQHAQTVSDELEHQLAEVLKKVESQNGVTV